jgi:hypothetical protein
VSDRPTKPCHVCDGTGQVPVDLQDLCVRCGMPYGWHRGPDLQACVHKTREGVLPIGEGWTYLRAEEGGHA